MSAEKPSVNHRATTKLCWVEVAEGLKKKQFWSLTARAKLENSLKQRQRDFEGDHAIFHELSAIKLGANRSSTTPPLVSADFFFAPSAFAMPLPAPKEWKNKQVLVVWAPFRIFHFLPSLFFLGSFEFQLFPLLGVGAFPRKLSPSTGFIYVPPLSSQTQSLTQNS